MANFIDEIENKEIRTEVVDFSFGELLNLHRDKEIIIRPEYQRLFRWSIKQRSQFIESILIRLPIPPIFLIENNNGVLELIDGLQRTSSVLQFIDHVSIDQEKLVLQGCDILTNINGLSYDDLSTAIRLSLKRTPVRAVIIKRSGDDYVKYIMFKRLNTGGSLLSPQEIRNCSSRMLRGGDEFYSKLQNLAEDKNFLIAASRIPEPDVERRAKEELVLRYFAIRHYQENFKGSVTDWLDSFMEEILIRKMNLIDETSEFRAFFAFIAEKFGDTAFSRSREGEAFGRLAPAYFEAVVGALAGNLDNMISDDEKILKLKLSEAFETAEFKSASGPGANSKEKMKDRIKIITKALLKQ